MYDFIDKFRDMRKLRLKQNNYFRLFEPNECCTVSGILSGGPDKTAFIPKPLLSRLQSCTKQYLGSLQRDYDDHGEGSFIGISKVYCVENKDTVKKQRKQSCETKNVVSEAVNFQKKISMLPLEELFCMAKIADSERGSGNRMRDVVTNHVATRKRQKLIVVASLISRPANLGGLSRTCEIFNAEQLVVSNLKVRDDPMFRSLSVTAYKWLPMSEVDVDGIEAFLSEQKKRGYTVIALEQTADSTSLPAYCFPERVCLLLGREKEGIPVELLNMVDACVEIPQFGLIRSLNVHVSASLLIWEMTRQGLCR